MNPGGSAVHEHLGMPVNMSVTEEPHLALRCIELCFDTRWHVDYLQPPDTVPLHVLIDVGFLSALEEAVFGTVVRCILGPPDENLADCSC